MSIVQFIDLKNIELTNEDVIQDFNNFRISFFSNDLEKMQSKDFSRKRTNNCSLKVNSNVIFETKQFHDLQFDLHPATDLSIVIASTFIHDVHIKEARVATLQVLSLVRDMQEVGTLEVSISKERVQRPNSKQAKRPASTREKKKTRTEPVPLFEKQAVNASHSLLDNLANRSQQSWVDPLDDEAGPGSQETSTVFGKKNTIKNNYPSYSFGTKPNQSKMFQSRTQERENFLKEGPPIKYSPNYNQLKRKESNTIIGNSMRIDEKLLNPLSGRSPGPIYNSMKDIKSRGLNKSFSTDGKLKDPKVHSPNATRQTPNTAFTQRKASAATFKNSHSDWKSTQTREKERQMTCTSEPALYRKEHSSKDISNKQSSKIRIGTERRPCMEPTKPSTPGPGRYGSSRLLSEFAKTGTAFGRAEKKFDVKKLGRWQEYGMKGK